MRRGERTFNPAETADLPIQPGGSGRLGKVFPVTFLAPAVLVAVTIGLGAAVLFGMFDLGSRGGDVASAPASVRSSSSADVSDQAEAADAQARAGASDEPIDEGSGEERAEPEPATESGQVPSPEADLDVRSPVAEPPEPTTTATEATTTTESTAKTTTTESAPEREESAGNRDDQADAVRPAVAQAAADTEDGAKSKPKSEPETRAGGGPKPTSTTTTSTIAKPTTTKAKPASTTSSALNRRPTIQDPGDRTTVEGEGVVLAVRADDPDGGSITYSAIGLPQGLRLDAASGLITGSPTVVGTHSATLRARDDRGATAQTSFTWRVTAKPKPTNCSLEGSVRSLSSRTEIFFRLTNQTDQTLTVYWLNYSGDRVQYHRIRPGVTINRQTYETHPWVLTDPSGNCVHLVPEPRNGDHVVVGD